MRITCPEEMFEGMMCPATEGLFLPTTESTRTRVVPCAEGLVGWGYERVCDA